MGLSISSGIKHTIFHYISQNAGQGRILILITLKPKRMILKNKVFTSTLEKFCHTGLRKIVIVQHHQSKLHSKWKTLNPGVRKTESIQLKHRSVDSTQQGGK